MRTRSFSLARLLLGLALLGISVLHVVAATGGCDVSLYVLFMLLPAVLLLAGPASGGMRALRRRKAADLEEPGPPPPAVRQPHP